MISHRPAGGFDPRDAAYIVICIGAYLNRFIDSFMLDYSISLTSYANKNTDRVKKTCLVYRKHVKAHDLPKKKLNVGICFFFSEKSRLSVYRNGTFE